MLGVLANAGAARETHDRAPLRVEARWFLVFTSCAYAAKCLNFFSQKQACAVCRLHEADFVDALFAAKDVIWLLPGCIVRLRIELVFLVFVMLPLSVLPLFSFTVTCRIFRTLLESESRQESHKLQCPSEIPPSPLLLVAIPSLLSLFPVIAALTGWVDYRAVDQVLIQ